MASDLPQDTPAKARERGQNYAYYAMTEHEDVETVFDRLMAETDPLMRGYATAGWDAAYDERKQ